MKNPLNFFKKGKETKEIKVLKMIQSHGGEKFLSLGQIHDIPEVPSLFGDYSEKINYSVGLAECLRELEFKGYLDDRIIPSKLPHYFYKISRLGLARLRRENA